MGNILTFKKYYFALASVLFVVEVLIALYAHDRIVRPYVGDFLVVILLYCFARSFVETGVLRTAVCVLVFSYFIEVLQYFNLVGRLGLQNSRLAKTIIGSSFEWLDLLAYTLGIAAVLYMEKLIAGRSYGDPTPGT